MALHNSLHTGSATGYVQAVDARLSMAGSLAADGGVTTPALGVRQGVIYGPGSPLLVTGTSSTSPWQYSVAAGAAVTSKGTLDGPHVVVNDAPYLASTTAPPASNSRYDVVYIMQQDSAATISPDASTAGVVDVVNGTAAASPTVPDAPAGSLVLAVALVESTATAGTSGAGVTITTSGTVGTSPLIAPYTTDRGAPIPVRTLAERDALTQYAGLIVDRLDLGILQRSTGSAWADVASIDNMGNPGSALAGITYPAASPSAPLITKTGMWHAYTTVQYGNEYADTVTFDTAFPTACAGVSITQIHVSNAVARSPIAIDTLSATTFRALYPGGTTSTERAFVWTAVGY